MTITTNPDGALTVVKPMPRTRRPICCHVYCSAESIPTRTVCDTHAKVRY